MTKSIYRLGVLYFTAIVAVSSGSNVLSQDAIPARTLDKLKNSTVFIKVALPGPDGTGSGFLLSKNATSGFIVTNAHVIESKSNSRTISVAFNSGTVKSVTLQATVVAEDKSTDLAILKVMSSRLPDPIEFEKVDVELRETLPVFILGFPFGNALAASSRGPATTIGRGSISSIRRDDFGNVEVVQVDGDINPGNSGGPVVTPSGKLIGVSVATVLGTQIGLAIPAKKLEELLKGRVMSVQLKQKPLKPGYVEVLATAQILAPAEQLKRVSVLMVEKRLVKSRLRPDEAGIWKAIAPRMIRNDLKIDGATASETFKLRGNPGETTLYYMQTKYTRADGKTFYTQPGNLKVVFPDKQVARSSGPETKPAKRDSIAKKDSTSKSDSSAKNSEASDGGWLGRETGKSTKEAGVATTEKRDADEGGWLGKKDIDTEENDTKDDDADAVTDKTDSDDGDWLGVRKNDATNPKRPIRRAGTAFTTGTELLGEKTTVVDAEMTLVKLDGKNLVDQMIWSKNAESVFVLDRLPGVLRKIAVPSFKEEMQLEFPGTCVWMDQSKEGLLVLVKDSSELWIVDERDLKVKKRISVGVADRVASAPSLSVAYVSNRHQARRLGIVDLESGRIAKEIDSRQFRKEQGENFVRHPHGLTLSSFYHPTVSSDGKYLFVGNECLHRLRIKGTNLIHEETEPRIGGSANRIEISPDGNYVALPSGGGNKVREGSGHKPLNISGTYIYRVTDLLKPAIGIPSGAHPRAIAMDRKAALIYAHNLNSQLITFSPRGVKLKEYVFPMHPNIRVSRFEPTRCFLVHPKGKRLLVLIETRLFWVQFK